jgi:hypothetical protein
MAKRGRDADDEIPSLPPPSFTSLPGVVHGVIASFLPDSIYRQYYASRLRLSAVSRALLESYGDSLTSTAIRDIQHGRLARLAALLRRQSKLKTVTVETQGPISPFPRPSPRAVVKVLRR